jgi:biopolymer transport protein ExbB
MPGASPLQLLSSGGWVMYPLVAVSLLSLTLCLERAAFWLRHTDRSMARTIAKVTAAAKRRRWQEASALAASEGSVVGRFGAALLGPGADDGGAPEIDQSDVAQAIEQVRGATERFGATLSAIITAAPMLGILGTVTGIIRSFRLLGAEGPVSDPTAVAAGIAEALITTAFGLVIALVTLFPYSVFRAKADRCLARLEAFGLALSIRASSK